MIALNTLTKQKEHSVYSARYGCAETCLINIAEITRNSWCSDREIDSIHGNWDRTGNVTVCNYEQVGPHWEGIRNDDLPSSKRWLAENDQMSHCRIQDWKGALIDAFWSLDIAFSLYDSRQFEILEYSGPKIPSHFCLLYDGTVINPDESISLIPLKVVKRFRI